MAVSSVGMLGEGITQGTSVSSQYMSRDQPSIGTISSSAPMLEMLVEQARELGDGHAVAHRHAKLPDEGLVARLQRRPFHLDAADRIGPVADDDGEAWRARRRAGNSPWCR